MLSLKRIGLYPWHPQFLQPCNFVQSYFSCTSLCKILVNGLKGLNQICKEWNSCKILTDKRFISLEIQVLNVKNFDMLEHADVVIFKIF